MKYLSFIFCLFILNSCSPKKDPMQPTWLVGNWERINTQSPNMTYETWFLNKKNKLIGLGVSLKERDTIFKEELSIITLNDTLYLQVIGVNENPTLFKFIAQTGNSFICENKQNNFPNKINYFLKDNKLNAVVSNKTTKIEFLFKRQKN